MKNLNKRDFLIVLFLVIAAPLGYTLKLLYKNYNIKENSAQYSIQISIKDNIENLNHYNFSEHFKSVKKAIDSEEKLGYFASCLVFNRYKDDLMTFNKIFYSSEELYNQNKDRYTLYQWCLNSYRYIDSNVSNKLLSSYYFSLGLSHLYGFKNPINIEEALNFMKRAYEIDNNPEINRIIHSIQKYKNIYPEFKDIFVLPYIDNEIKYNKIQ